MQVTIICFAQLREFFPKQSKLEFEASLSVQAACQKLLQILSKKGSRSKAEALLSVCKFSIGDEFVESDFYLEEGMVLCLLPPPSGG